MQCLIRTIRGSSLPPLPPSNASSPMSMRAPPSSLKDQPSLSSLPKSKHYKQIEADIRFLSFCLYIHFPCPHIHKLSLRTSVYWTGSSWKSVFYNLTKWQNAENMTPFTCHQKRGLKCRSQNICFLSPNLCPFMSHGKTKAS